MNNPNLEDRAYFYDKGIAEYINAILNSKYALGFACSDTSKEWCDCDEESRERCKNWLEATLWKIQREM